MQRKTIPVFPNKNGMHGMNLLVKGNRFMDGALLAHAAQIRRENASALARIAEADTTLATRLISREMNLPVCPEKELSNYPVFRAYLAAFLDHDLKRMDHLHEYLLHPFSNDTMDKFIKDISPHMSRLKYAIATYDDAMKLDPQTRGIHLPARDQAAQFYANISCLMSTILCDFMKKGRKDEAVNLLQSALEQNPQSPDLIWGIALTSMKGKFTQADALRASDMISKRATFPATPGIMPGMEASNWLCLSGDLLCLCGKLDLARQQYGQATVLVPNSVAAQVGLALCEVAENNLAAAKARLDVVLKYHPTSASANIVLAKIAKLEGKADDALVYASIASQCAQIYEELHEAHLLLGAWLFEKNDEKCKHHFIEAFGYPRHDKLPRLGVSAAYIGPLAILHGKFEASIKTAAEAMFPLAAKVPSPIA